MPYSKQAYYFNNETHGMHNGEFANYAIVLSPTPNQCF